MSYDTDSIKKFISPRYAGQHDWDNLVHHLEKAGDVGVWMPGIGQAYLVDNHPISIDGDDIYFVFKVTAWNGDRFFRLTSDTGSFGGLGHGILDEVRPVPVQKFDWETI